MGQGHNPMLCMLHALLVDMNYIYNQSMFVFHLFVVCMVFVIFYLIYINLRFELSYLIMFLFYQDYSMIEGPIKIDHMLLFTDLTDLVTLVT